MSEDDGEWLLTQNECVIKLWIEASLADPFGESFKPLTTHLKETSFKRARLALEAEGLFEFEPKYEGRDRRKIKHWMVKNLHGSETDHWKAQNTETSLQSSSGHLERKEIPCQERHAIDQERHAIDQERHAIESETLSLSNSCPSLDLIRLNKTESDLQKDFSSLSRSGRLELAPFTKVTGSAPSPDAKVTDEENPELLEDPWSTKLNPLTNTELHCDSSRSNDLNTGLEGCIRSQEGKYPARNVGIGEVNKISADSASNHPETPQPATPHVTLPPESPGSSPALAPIQSDTKLPEPTLEARTKLTQDEIRCIYLGVKDKLTIDGLLVGKCYTYLERFDFALKLEQLRPISDWFAQENREMTAAMQDDLVTDYLLCDKDDVGQSFICKQETDGTLTLKLWSEL
jgi:hypothetical protein